MLWGVLVVHVVYTYDLVASKLNTSQNTRGPAIVFKHERVMSRVPRRIHSVRTHSRAMVMLKRATTNKLGPTNYPAA